MATRGDVLDRVADLLEDTGTTTRSRLEPWVGFVLSEMKQAGVLGPSARATLSFAAGDSIKDLPADFEDLDQIFEPDSLTGPLIFQPQWLFAEHLVESSTEQGEPEFWTLRRRPTSKQVGQIEVWPATDSARDYTLLYKANFAALSDDADLLELTDDALTTAVWGLYRIATRLENNGDIREATEEYRLSLAREQFKQSGTAGRPYAVRYRDI